MQVIQAFHFKEIKVNDAATTPLSSVVTGTIGGRNLTYSTK
jgi:hypothetical protein